MFGRKPETNHRQFLLRKIAWRIQADREGGLSGAPLPTRLSRNAARRMAGMKPDQTATTLLPTGHDSRLPMPGGVIVKQFEGETLVVKVLADGFEFRDRGYRLQSAIALDLTVTQWNGFVFFLAGGYGRKIACGVGCRHVLIRPVSGTSRASRRACWPGPHGWGR